MPWLISEFVGTYNNTRSFIGDYGKPFIGETVFNQLGFSGLF